MELFIHCNSTVKTCPNGSKMTCPLSVHHFFFLLTIAHQVLMTLFRLLHSRINGLDLKLPFSDFAPMMLAKRVLVWHQDEFLHTVQTIIMFCSIVEVTALLRFLLIQR